MSYPAISLTTATVGRHRCPQKRLQTARQPPVSPNRARTIASVTSSPPFRWIRGDGSDSIAAISSLLWLPTGTGSPGSGSTSSYLSSNELTGCIPEGLRDVAHNDFQILGLDFCEVDSSDPLIVRYDANNNGTIEKGEVIAAINDYLFGAGDEAISKSDVIKLMNLYLFG